MSIIVENTKLKIVLHFLFLISCFINANDCFMLLFENWQQLGFQNHQIAG